MKKRGKEVMKERREEKRKDEKRKDGKEDKTYICYVNNGLH